MAYGFVTTELGDQLGDKDYLNEACGAFARASEIASAQKYTELQGSIENNLGIAFGELAKLTGRIEDSEAAASAFERALRSWSSNSTPVQLASARVNLANTLSQIAERRSDASGFENVIQILDDALDQWPTETRVSDRAAATNCLANALLRLGQITGRSEPLTRGAVELERTLAALSRSEHPLFWASTQSNLGNVYVALADLGENALSRLDDASAAYQLAIAERDRNQVPIDWASSANGLAGTLARRAELTQRPQPLVEAIALWREVLAVRRDRSAPLLWGQAASNLGSALVSLERLSTPQVKGELAGEGLELHKGALEVFKRLEMPHLVALSEQQIAAAQELLRHGAL